MNCYEIILIVISFISVSKGSGWDISYDNLQYWQSVTTSGNGKYVFADGDYIYYSPDNGILGM
jgi:hypothetical protein